jgi:hypothetical protein
MSSMYRLVEVDEAAHVVGIVETIELPPTAALIAIVSPDTLDRDLVRIREELREFFKAYGWERPVGVVRAGDLRFVRLVEVPE